MAKQPAVYILASEQNGPLYIGVTSDRQKRIWEHKNDFVEGLRNDRGFTVWCIMSCTRTWEQQLQEKTVEEMESGLEDGIDRETESRMDDLWNQIA